MNERREERLARRMMRESADLVCAKAESADSLCYAFPLSVTVGLHSIRASASAK